MTCWASSSALYLVAALLFTTGAARAAEGVVNATGTGRDTSEAITNLLRTTVGKYFKEQPQLTRAILQTEIVPNASSFVQSYKLNEGSKGGAVSLSANVDLDVIHGLLSLTPKNIGEDAGAKALVLVRGAKLSDSLLASLKSKPPPDPFAPLAEAAKERFFRREFTDAELSAEDLQATGAGDEISSPELLRGLGAKAGARVVLAITGKYETYENENAHNKEERVVLAATLVDVKTGGLLGRAQVNVVNPKSRKEQYVADLQRNVIDESKDLLQDIFVAAGRKLVKAETHDDFTVVRVQFASNATLVARFRQMLEAVPGARSVTELSVSRGKFDFAVRPRLAEASIVKSVMAAQAQASDISVLPIESLASAAESEPHPPAVSVKLEPKETVPAAGLPPANVPDKGGANAVPSPRR